MFIVFVLGGVFVFIVLFFLFGMKDGGLLLFDFVIGFEEGDYVFGCLMCILLWRS